MTRGPHSSIKAERSIVAAKPKPEGPAAAPLGAPTNGPELEPEAPATPSGGETRWVPGESGPSGAARDGSSSAFKATGMAASNDRSAAPPGSTGPGMAAARQSNAAFITAELWQVPDSGARASAARCAGALAPAAAPPLSAPLEALAAGTSETT